MKSKPRIFIIAGEVSGDVMGAKIMSALRVYDVSGGKPQNVEFAGVGGENMRVQGLRSLFPISDLAVMGFAEVLARARTLTHRIRQTADAIIKSRPDIVLTIDSPGFVKRVIKRVKKNGAKNIRFYHVVAPQVWAWGPGRAKLFAEIFDKLYCFFDFEAPYFTKYGLDTVAVGHPIADGLRPVIKKPVANSKEQNIALIPGSRMSEVKRLLPVLKGAAEELRHRNPNIWWNFYIPVVETTEKYIREQTKNWRIVPTLIPGVERYKLFAETDIAVAASGTVSAELAIMHIPTVVVYKMNPLTEFLARIFVRVKWVSLVNVLLKKSVYPELLGRKANPENIAARVLDLTTPAVRDKIISELTRADKLWRHGDLSPAELIARDIVRA